MIPYSESAATGWPPAASVSGSISSAWRTLPAPAKSARNQRPSQYAGHEPALACAGRR